MLCFTDGRATQGAAGGEEARLDSHDDDVRQYGDVADADIMLLSTDQVVSPVRSLVLPLACASKLLDGPRKLSGAICTGLDSSTLSRFLNVCHPYPSFHVSNFRSPLQLYHAACSLQIRDTSFVATPINNCLDLMIMYFIAAEQVWEAGVQVIARPRTNAHLRAGNT